MNTEQTSKNIVTYKTRIYITPDFIDGKEIKESIEYKKKKLFSLGTLLLKIYRPGRFPIGKINLLCDAFLVQSMMTRSHTSLIQLNKIRKRQ